MENFEAAVPDRSSASFLNFRKTAFFRLTSRSGILRAQQDTFLINCHGKNFHIHKMVSMMGVVSDKTTIYDEIAYVCFLIK